MKTGCLGEDFVSQTQREMKEFERMVKMNNRYEKFVLIVLFSLVTIVVYGLAF